MAGFIRRYGFVPPEEVITQIEGAVILDLPPPGAINGVNTGMVGLVGEFADMTYAAVADGSGVVSSRHLPQQITSAQDMLDKLGGFDPTLGDFGAADGNGFVALRNKRYSALVVVPVNLCSATGVRYMRQLPLNVSATNPTPVVTVDGAQIDAGREFRSPTNGRLKIGARVVFTALDPIAVGTGGATANAASAATQTFTVAGADFSAIVRPDGQIGIKRGDILVIGNNNGGALQPLPSGGNLGAGTYRVQADATSGAPTVLVVEQLSGANFAFVTANTIPWRIHVSSDADSAPVIVLGSSTAGGYQASGLGGYSVPSRPLTDEAGALTNGTWTAGLVLSPLVVPPALTGDTWDPLSGLFGRIIPTGGLVYVAATQAPNAVNVAGLDTLYAAALASLIANQAPLSDINIVFSARTSAAIRTALRSHVLTASQRNLGRMALVRPELTTLTVSAAVGASSPGVGATRNERVIYNWCGVRTFIPEAVSVRLKTADSLTTIDGILDTGWDAWVASLLSNLPPENNPGQASAPVPDILSPIIGLQRGAPNLDLAEYILLRQSGVAAPRIDATVGPILQSGITSSLVSGQKNISRRRMADFIQDSIARRIIFFVKQKLTQANQDAMTGEVQAFLAELLSEDNIAAQRIAGFTVDAVSGNTAARLAKGIFTIIVKVRLLASADFIVLQTEIGENVFLQTDLAA